MIFRAFLRGRSRPGAPLWQIWTRPRPESPQEPHRHHADKNNLPGPAPGFLVVGDPSASLSPEPPDDEGPEEDRRRGPAMGCDDLIKVSEMAAPITRRIRGGAYRSFSSPAAS